jgi:cytochrome c biogenesis protein CcdA/thiol-disulfide isomerase/thioredoxin
VLELLAIAFVGGLITGISPCIIPVLPVIMAGGATDSSRRRPFLIIGGLIVSFTVQEFIGATVLNALGLPLSLTRWVGIVALFVLATALLFPGVETWVEKPFARLGGTRYATKGGGFVLGLSLGLVFAPCAGPVYSAVAAATNKHELSANLLFTALAYAVGAGVPLLILAVVAQRTTTQWSRLRTHLPAVRRWSGVIVAVTALVIAVGGFDYLQTHTPGFTSSLENSVESTACTQLAALSHEHVNQYVKKEQKLEGHSFSCTASGSSHSTTVAANSTTAKGTTKSNLPDLGKAPDFTGIVSWFNTPGNQPLTLAQLKGKIVLVDFWTYSCINCQRSLPHVEGWYNDYKKDGLVVVGVSTPEFAFEHVVSNVQSAAGNLGIDYPVAIDNNYGTWDAYNNEYWPAEYLIDQTGQVRAYDFGEGGYSTMEKNIRSLLAANGVAKLPASTDVANKTPTSTDITPESYVGYQQVNNDVGTPIVQNKAAVYHAPSTIPPNSLAFNGTWTEHSQEATSGANAMLDLHFSADDVYLVMGGTGTVSVSDNGKPLTTLNVHGIPTLYTLFSAKELSTGTLTLTLSPGVQAYDFTFG